MFRKIILVLFIIFFIYLFTSKIVEGARFVRRSGHKSNSGDPKGRHAKRSQLDDQRRKNNAQLKKNRKAANKAKADAKVAAAAAAQRQAAAAIANRPRYITYAPPNRGFNSFGRR
jgi:hypothetical protein